VEYCEIATPLTYEHFTQHWLGAIYGLSLACERFRRDNDVWNNVRTPLPGLYQTGADQFLSGICGAMLGGMLTVAALPGGIGLAELFTRCLRW
jgi:phytoene dehydrogenase-like protein